MQGRHHDTTRMAMYMGAALLCSGNAASTLGAFFGAAGLEMLLGRVRQSHSLAILTWAVFIALFLSAHFFAARLTARLGPRTSMIMSNWIRSLVFVFAALSANAGISPSIVPVLGAVAGLFSGLCQSVALAVLSSLVPRDRLSRANAIVLATSAVAALSGVVLGRVTASLFGPVPELLFAAVVSSSVALMVCYANLEPAAGTRMQSGTSCADCRKGCT